MGSIRIQVERRVGKMGPKRTRNLKNVDVRVQLTTKNTTCPSKCLKILGLEELQALELDNQLEKQMRKRRGDLSNGDKHQDDVGDGCDGRMSSRDDHTNDGKKKCEKRKDEKYRDKYREEMGRENKHRYDKHRDKHSVKDHSRNRSDHKHAKEEKDNADSQQKRTKHVESDHNRGHNHNLNCDKDQYLESSDDHKPRHERVHAHDRDCYRENRVRKRNSEERDDCNNTRFRVHKIHCSDTKRSSNILDSNADRGGSQQPQAHDDSIGTSSIQSNVNSEDMKFKESITDMELRTKGLRERLSGMSRIGPGYKSPGKSTKIDDDLANERSSSSKMDLVERPFMGSLGVDVRDNSNPQYRRNNDAGFGRGHGYSWRVVPNWTLLVPNGFAPFQHGPTHGGFQAMTPMFPSHALFVVRPPMECNHASIPYHIPNLDRFSGHMRPLGWQNMMEGTLPSHFHGWDGNNCVFKDNSHVYGSSDWDWNRHLSNSRGLDSGPEISKDQNGHLKRDSTSPTCKDVSVPFQVNGGSTDPATHMSQDDCNWGDVPEKFPRTKLSSFESSGKVPTSYSPKTMPEKTAGTLTPSDNTFLSQNYLSKLDISAELALPELYDQCMSLLDVEKNAFIDSDASTGFLKHGSRSRQRYAATLSPFPADSSLFQRAIEHYKKERVELPKWGKVDVNLANNRKQLDEPVSSSSLVNMRVGVSTDDALTNMPISTLHLNKEETLSPPAEEHLEELHQNLCQRGQDRVCAHPVNQESLAAGLGKEDEFTSEWLITSDVEGKHNTVVINESKLESKMNTSDDIVNTKDKITGFAHYAEELSFGGDTLGSPLICEDDTPGACDALVSGSNESESLILSWVHHSFGSTP